MPTPVVVPFEQFRRRARARRRKAGGKTAPTGRWPHAVGRPPLTPGQAAHRERMLRWLASTPGPDVSPGLS